MRAFAVSISAAFFVFVQVAACGSDGGSPFDGGSDVQTADVLSCSTPQKLCGAQCVDTSSDVYNCGTCGHTCAGGEACCAAYCVKSTGCGFAVTGVQPARGNQSGGDWVNLTGAGFTADMSVYIGNGRAPTLVIDATHARIQTPPGTVGTYDITLIESTGTSVTHAAFALRRCGSRLALARETDGERAR